MTDSTLRELERRCEADPGDQGALGALIEARYRAGLPVTCALLERRVKPERSFDSPFPLAVRATSPGGEELAIGWTPGPLQIPEHRSWRVEVWGRSRAHLRAVVADLAGRGVRGVRLYCDGLADGDLAELRGLGDLADLELTWFRGYPRPRGIGDAGFEVLATIPTLTRLRVTNSPELTDGGLAHLGALPRLTSLRLDVPSAIHRIELPQLSELKGSFPSSDLRGPLGELPNLERLELLGKRLSLDGFKALRRFTALEGLVVAAHRFEVDHVACLRDMPKLERLTVGRDGVVTEDALRALRELPLRAVRLNLSEVSTERVAAAAEIPSLDALTLVNVDDAVDLGSLTEHPNLRRVAFVLGYLLPAHLRAIALPSLESLAWSGTGVSPEGIAHLAGLPRLQELDCHNLPEEAVEHFTGMPALRRLYARVTGWIRRPFLARLAALPNLRDLELDFDGSGFALETSSAAVRFEEGALGALSTSRSLTALTLSQKIALSEVDAAAVGDLASLDQLSLLGLDRVGPPSDATLARLAESLGRMPGLRFFESRGLSGEANAQLERAVQPDCLIRS